MNIENTVYRFNGITGEKESINANIDGINVSVPLDPANRHYAAIMEMVDAGELAIVESGE